MRRRDRIESFNGPSVGVRVGPHVWSVCVLTKQVGFASDSAVRALLPKSSLAPIRILIQPEGESIPLWSIQIRIQ